MIPTKTFVPFNKKWHNRNTFDCGTPQTQQLSKTNANRGMQARINYTWVLPEAGEEARQNNPLQARNICAYYTLSICNIERDTLPPKLSKSLPTYPLPAFLLGQLAVHTSCQGQGLGDVTLINAIRRCAALSQKGQVPAIAMVLDVIDEKAMAFYRRFPDFLTLQTKEHQLPRLYLPMKVVEKI